LGESSNPGEAQPTVIEIDLDLITPNKQQPRQRFDGDELSTLAQSIRQSGVIQPILLRRMADGYEIIVGERRWRAAQSAGLARIPAIVRDLSDSQMLSTALIENVQRADLNSLEIAIAYERLVTDAGLSHAQVAKFVGVTRSSVTNYLRLLSLPESIKSDLLDEKLSMGHARALLALDSARKQRALADMIIARDLSVRQTEKLVRNMTTPTPVAPPKPTPELDAIRDELRGLLGTKVAITGTRKGAGRIQIEYYSHQDLERLLLILRGE